MAGDVTVSVVSGPSGIDHLEILGDALSNQIRITDLPGGDYEVEGLNGTTINLQPVGTPYQTPSPINGDIKARMGDGDDSIRIDQAFSAPAILGIQGGAGDDTVRLAPLTGQVAVGDTLYISMGNGNDRVRLEDTDASSLRVRTGDGIDHVRIRDTRIGGGTISRIRTGDGNDRLRIDSGSEFFGPLSVNMGDGNDRYRLGTVTFHDVHRFSGRDGNDSVFVGTSANVDFRGVTRFYTGAGNDRIYVLPGANVRFQSDARFVTGAGNDRIDVRQLMKRNEDRVHCISPLLFAALHDFAVMNSLPALGNSISFQVDGTHNRRF